MSIVVQRPQYIKNAYSRAESFSLCERFPKTTASLSNLIPPYFYYLTNLGRFGVWFLNPAGIRKKYYCVYYYTLRRVPIKKDSAKTNVLSYPSSNHRPVVRRPFPLRDWRSRRSNRGDGRRSGSGRPVVTRRPARSAAAPPSPSSLPSPPPPLPPCRRRPPSARCRRHQFPWGRAPSPALPFPASMMARPRSPTTNCRCRCHSRCRRRRLRRAPPPPPSCCVVRSSAARLPRVVRPPPLVESSASSTPHTTLSDPPPPLVVSSAARPPHGNIATALSLRPPPPPSRSLRAIHCRLLHAVIARTLPPPLSTQHPPSQRTKASIIAKKATAFATAMVLLLAQGTFLESNPPDGAAAAPPPQAILPRAAGRWVWERHLRESNRSPLRGTSLPPRRHRASFAFTNRPADPRPLRASPQPHRPCARGRLPAGNEAINQDGQHVVGRRHMPPSSPLQFSQPANPPILLFAQLIFQSRLYKFSTPNFPLTKKKVMKTTLCTTGCSQLPPKYPVFLEGVLELLCRDILMSIVQIRQWSYFQNNPVVLKSRARSIR